MMTKMKLIGLVVLLSGFSSTVTSQETAGEKEPKVHIFVSGLYNPQAFTISDSRSIPMYLEESSFRGDWTSEAGPAFIFGGSYEILSGLSVGAAFEFLSSTPTETFEAGLPHPLYFDRDRSLTGGPISLSYEENAAHFLLSYARTMGRFVLAVSGGPSYFMTKTEVLDTFTYTESYPFDEAALESIHQSTFDANGLGFNVGSWIGFRLLKQLAVGADIRYSRAKPKFTTSAGNEVEVNAGGARVGVGIRFMF
jgi:hypothetical protein